MLEFSKKIIIASLKRDNASFSQEKNSCKTAVSNSCWLVPLKWVFYISVSLGDDDDDSYAFLFFHFTHHPSFYCILSFFSSLTHQLFVPCHLAIFGNWQKNTMAFIFMGLTLSVVLLLLSLVTCQQPFFTCGKSLFPTQFDSKLTCPDCC